VFLSSACFLALIYFVLLEAVTCPLLVEVIHSAIKKMRGSSLACFKGEAWPFRKAAIRPFLKSAEQRREQLRLRKKRDFVAEISTPILSSV
jgi:hypothetical protein